MGKTEKEDEFGEIVGKTLIVILVLFVACFLGIVIFMLAYSAINGSSESVSQDSIEAQGEGLILKEYKFSPNVTIYDEDNSTYFYTEDKDYFIGYCYKEPKEDSQPVKLVRPVTITDGIVDSLSCWQVSCENDSLGLGVCLQCDYNATLTLKPQSDDGVGEE